MSIRCCIFVICLLIVKLTDRKAEGDRITDPDRLPYLNFTLPTSLTVPPTWHSFRAAHVVTRTAAPFFSGYAIIARTLALAVRQVAS